MGKEKGVEGGLPAKWLSQPGKLNGKANRMFLSQRIVEKIWLYHK